MKPQNKKFPTISIIRILLIIKEKDERAENVNPLGEKFGQGDTIMKGAAGQVPEDLVQTPLRDIKDQIESKLGDITFGLELDSDVDELKFSIPGDDIFVEGGTEIKKDVYKRFDQLAKIFTKVQGEF